MAAAPDINSARYWSYKVLNKTYTQNEINAVGQGTFGPVMGGHHANSIVTDKTRKIPVQSIAKGAIFFHYGKFPDRNYGETDDLYQKRLLTVLLGQFGIPIEYDVATQTWILCFGKIVKNYHYYYPNPSAGFGIQGFGNSFNAAFVCYTTRASKWAYLKSGTSINEKRASHRRHPMTTFQNYDYMRLKTCDLVFENGACRPGNNYDICLTPSFQYDNNIDGISSIAAMDDLMDIRKNGIFYSYDTNKSMYTAINNWFQQIHTHGDLDEDLRMWTINLLCLETDLKGSTLNVGFREFANSPCGYKHKEPDFIPPRNLPQYYGVVQNLAAGIQGNYIVTDEEYKNGSCVKRKFHITDARISSFYTTYVVPHLLMKPGIIITPIGTLSLPLEQEEAVPLMPLVVQMTNDELRYQLNHSIAQWLNENLASILFDFRLNVLFGNQAGISNLGQTINIRFDRNPANKPAGMDDYTIGYPYNYYMQPLTNSMNLELFKILHEVISNTKWTTKWMHEIKFPGFQIPQNDTILDFNDMYVPVGPFYNPLTIPALSDSNSILSIYKGIIQKIEASPVGYRHSWTYDFLQNANLVNFIRVWSMNLTQNTFTYSNQAYDYDMGRWFADVLIAEGQAYIGGKRKTQRAGRINRVVDSDFLSDPIFRKNIIQSTKKRKTKGNKKRQKNIVEDVKSGHTSTTIEPMSEDTFRSLQKLLYDSQYTPLLKSLFIFNEETNRGESE